MLGFGLVIPFLPGRGPPPGRQRFVATLPARPISLMQFLFIPVWGGCPTGSGRGPVMLWSIAPSAIGMALLGFATAWSLLFAARF